MKIGIPKNGRFGDFGGKYIPETLAPAIEELEKNYLKIRNDAVFKNDLNKLFSFNNQFIKKNNISIDKKYKKINLTVKNQIITLEKNETI